MTSPLLQAAGLVERYATRPTKRAARVIPGGPGPDVGRGCGAYRLDPVAPVFVHTPTARPTPTREDTP